ncbi:hypothetical protein IV501_02020 [Lacisediminihabitans sp. G11-30]|uniref:Uncharacterized protein n=2 Tax=Lacisediminihabitans changchengi TaxID=2787634 RepID=A0A934W2P5_9MICO|nr:hypothetical protein [Lacisediminihabitans changchengi]
MRWGKLFDDLEGQLEQELEAEEVDLRAEEERLRLGRLSLRDRLLALHRDPACDAVTLQLADHRVSVRPVSIGKDWLSGDLVDGTARGLQCIVPLASIDAVIVDRKQVRLSLVPQPEEDGSRLSARLGLAFVLRDLCRRRRAVELVTASGIIVGTIDRVGRDHLDLAEHPIGVARRESAVLQYRVLPFERLVYLRLS